MSENTHSISQNGNTPRKRNNLIRNSHPVIQIKCATNNSKCGKRNIFVIKFSELFYERCYGKEKSPYEIHGIIENILHIMHYV